MRTIDSLRPMLLDSRKYVPFNSPDWLFEIKNDGYRMICEFGADGVQMRTRGGYDCAGWFPEVSQALGTFRGGPFIVDDEVCVMDDLGHSDFDRLQERAVRRSHFRGCHPVVYTVFDLLMDRGRSVMDLPLTERRRGTRGSSRRSRSRLTLFVMDAISEHGIELYALAVELKLEGPVAKRADSIYVPASGLWPGGRSSGRGRCRRNASVAPEEGFG